MDARLTLAALTLSLAGCFGSYGSHFDSQITGRNVAAGHRTAVQNCAIVHDPVTNPAAVELARIHTNGDMFQDALGCQGELANQAKHLGANVVYVTTNGKNAVGGNSPTCDGIAYSIPEGTSPTAPPSTTSAPATAATP